MPGYTRILIIGCAGLLFAGAVQAYPVEYFETSAEAAAAVEENDIDGLEGEYQVSGASNPFPDDVYRYNCIYGYEVRRHTAPGESHIVYQSFYGCVPWFQLAYTPLPDTGEDCETTVGNPIDVRSGNKFHRRVLDIARDRLQLSLYYNSRYRERDVGLGHGWRHGGQRALGIVHEKPYPDEDEELSDEYATAQDACTQGWEELKPQLQPTVSEDLSVLTPVYDNGRCRLEQPDGTPWRTLALYRTVSRPKNYPGGYDASGQPVSELYAFRPDGSVIVFRSSSGTSWVNKSGEREQVVQTAVNGTTAYEYHTAGDQVELYDADGRLVSITDVRGNQRTMSYDASDRLERIDTDTGESVNFSYNAGGRVDQITDHAGRTWHLQYDGAGNLEYLIEPDGTPGDTADNPRERYHYEHLDFPHALTGITDENQVRYATYDYDAQGRAILSTHPGDADKVAVTYNPDGTRTVTNGRGVQSQYSVSAAHNRRQLDALAGPACAGCAQQGDTALDYDAQTNYVVARTENGVTTAYNNLDARGRPGTVIQSQGTAEERAVDYEYDPRFHRRITRISEPSVYAGARKETTYTYDAHGNRTEATVSGFTPQGDPVSRTTQWQYGGDGTVECQDVPRHQLCRIDGPRTDVADITVFDYYPDDPAEGANRARLRRVTGPTGILERDQIQYDAHGNILSEQRPNNLQITYSYTPGHRRLASVTRTDTATGQSQTTRWTYQPSGEVQTLTQADGSPDAQTLTFSYDDARRLVQIANDTGQSIAYTLDEQGNRLAEKTYDAGGILRRQLEQTFDLYDRLDLTVTSQASTDDDYNADGTLARHSDGKGTITDYSYDALRRLTRTDHNAGGSDPATADTQTLYQYNSHDRLTAVTDPDGLTTTYVYDDLGNRLRQTSPDTGTSDYAYDAAGNRTAHTDARGVTAVYHYDALNRLTRIEYPDPDQNIHYDYDEGPNGLGRLTQITDNSGATEYRYDARGNITETVHHVVVNDQPQSYTIAYQYNGADQLTRITYPSGRTVDYTRNTAGQVSAITTDWHGHSQSLAQNIAYQPFGPFNTLTYGNGLGETRTYDLDGRVTQIAVPGVHTLNYGYDLNSNINTWQDSLEPAADQAFQYDPLDRLVQADGTYGLFDYQYTPTGDRTQKTVDTTDTETYTYNTGTHHLAQRAGASQTLSYQYDAAGNTLGNGTHQFTYNQAGRLAAVSQNGQNLAHYRYNALGQRVLKTAGNDSRVYFYDLDGNLIAELDLARNTHTEYVYHNARPLAQTAPRPDLRAPALEHTLIDNQDPNKTATVTVNTATQTLGFQLSTGESQSYAAAPTWTETRENDERELTIADPQTGETEGFELDYSLHLYENAVSATLHLTPKDGSPERFFTLETPVAQTPPVMYTHTDHLGTPKQMTDQSQTVVWEATYTPFGSAIVDGDPDGDGDTVTNNLRFPGQYFDEETGLHYNDFRYYNPSTGRYITSDPIGLNGGLNAYAYVTGNPVMYIDPLGLLPDWLEKAKKNRQKNTYTEHRAQHPKKHDDIFNPNKKRNKQKREKKQLNDICKEYDIKDRNDFGEFLEEWKSDNGYRGGDTLPYGVLRDAAKAYKGL